jgi:replicative DNA helicase
MPQTGDFVVLAGYPSVGKTEFNYFMARENSSKNKVVYFALELP